MIEQKRGNYGKKRSHQLTQILKIMPFATKIDIVYLSFIIVMLTIYAIMKYRKKAAGAIGLMKKQPDKRYWGYGEYAWDNLKWRLILGAILAVVCGIWWLVQRYID